MLDFQTKLSYKTSTGVKNTKLTFRATNPNLIALPEGENSSFSTLQVFVHDAVGRSRTLMLHFPLFPELNCYLDVQVSSDDVNLRLSADEINWATAFEYHTLDATTRSLHIRGDIVEILTTAFETLEPVTV